MPRPMLATLLVLAALPAAAQDRPPIIPTRDVAITYRVTGNAANQGGVQSLSMAWQAASQTMRMDMPGMGWMVADHRGQRAFMVMEQQRMVMELPMAQAMQQYGPSDRASYTREGTDTVAGLSCTIWRYQDGPNQGRACVTADGVMLRAQGTHQGQSGGLEATRVTYGQQDPARFQVPAGYQRMQMPGGMPGMPPAPRPTR